jgi:cytochrome c-type biogenesis protein CcmE
MSVILTPEELKARNRRNLWIALSVAAFIVLVFAITLTQMQANVLDRPL